MLTVSKLLENIPSEGSLENKKLEKILKITKKLEKEKLNIAINALCKLGILTQDESGFITLIKNDSLIEARLRCSNKGYCFAIREDGEEDIYIRDQFLNNAWHGDIVLVKLTKEGFRRRSPEGEIQCILERHTTKLVCILDKQEDKIVAIPLEERILSPINLTTNKEVKIEKTLLDNVVEVRIDKYPIAQYPAEGTILRKLPLNKGPEGDKDFLLAKVGINSDPIVPKIALKKPNEKNRIDLTSQPCLILKSWSNKDCPVLPAFNIEAKEGGVKLWIHIPAVSERIGIGSNLDKWLQEKGEAFCLGDDWQALLSESLTNACGFKVNENNSAISLSIDICSEGTVKDYEFFLSTINPKVEISPEILNTLNSRKPNSRTLPVKLKPIKEYIIRLETLLFASELILKYEKELGLIELDLNVPEINYLSELQYLNPGENINQWKLPINKLDPQSIISPFVRLANKIYSTHCIDLNIPAITINSQTIEDNTLNEIAKVALALDLQLELDEQGVVSTKELSAAFAQNPYRRVLDKLFKNFLPKQALSCYQPKLSLNNKESVIDQENISSSFISYAPWCSPGDHYYDIINQFILTNLLNEGKNRLSTRSKNKLNLGKKDSYKDVNWQIFSEPLYISLSGLISSRILNLLNKKRRQSIFIRSQIIAMAKSRSVESLVGKEVEATISGVQSYGFFAELPPYLAEGLVHVSNLNDDWYEYRSRQNRLVGRKSKQSYQLGDKVTVKVVKIDILRNQIDLDVVKVNLIDQKEETPKDESTKNSNNNIEE